MATKCPIQSQVALANDSIQQFKKRVAVLEDQLRSPKFPDEKRKIVETELVEIKKLLDRNEEILKSLHKENSKTFVLAVMIMFLCFLVYGVYMMFWGIPK